MTRLTTGRCTHLLIALALPVLLSAQEPTFEQRQSIDSVGALLGRYGRTSDSAWIVGQFRAGKIYFTPSSETGIDRQDRVFVNAALGEQTRTRDATQRHRALADLAATLLHERVHLGQSHFAQGASRLQNLAGGGHPSEVEAWRVGFDTYRDFIAHEENILRNATTEREREQAATRVRELMRAFERYRSEYELPGNHFGAMRFADGKTLAEVTAAHAQRTTELDRILVRVDFTTSVSPYRVVVKPGEVFTVTAATVGGAFNASRQKGRTRLYTYEWAADGARLPGSGATLRRTATRGEVLTVVAVDRLGAKSSEGRCLVVVDEAEVPVRAPTIAAPAPAPATGGRWVRIRTERVDSVLDPGRVRSHSFSDGSYAAEVLYPRQPEPTSERGSWTAPGGTLTPGTDLALTVTGAVWMTVDVSRGLPTREAMSLEDRPAVWKVSRGSGADHAFITVHAGGRFVMCTMMYVYKWEP
ncbi:MAG: hypothetical protein IT355_20330 [Gemmatimonadaceae bacterium]|nr:hypothetical protein [Gemmatimonadaceae bacterium]